MKPGSLLPGTVEESEAAITLDPKDWTDVRALGHTMLDDMFDYLENISQRPAWRPIPRQVRESFRGPLPVEPTDIASVYHDFTELILPYSTGNVHPGFLGWVHGGGTVAGMLAEMLAGGLNANLGGRDHIPIEVERQITEWMRHIFGFPEGASGLFVTGTSVANFIALLVARDTARRGDSLLNADLQDRSLVVYASRATHSCIQKAMAMSGLGAGALRLIEMDSMHRIRAAELKTAIAADRKAGLKPFLIVGNAGTVDIGAIDPLDELSDIASHEGLWFHVDGAFGAMAMLAPNLAPLLKGIERADSIAFDFHKWAQVPYDAGFVLVRNAKQHFDAFATPAAYLRRETRGAAAGAQWPCDFGPDLSRGFRALKTWFTLKTYGTAQLGAVISRTCELAQHARLRIEENAALELAAPVQLNIVCFRFRGSDIHSDLLNAGIVADIQESGIAVPSTTVLDGRLAIRAAIVNHRTQTSDIDSLISAVLKFGEQETRGNAISRSG